MFHGHTESTTFVRINHTITQGVDGRTAKTLNDEFSAAGAGREGGVMSVGSGGIGGASRVSLKSHGKNSMRKGSSSAEALRGNEAFPPYRRR